MIIVTASTHDIINICYFIQKLRNSDSLSDISQLKDLFYDTGLNL